MMVQVSKENALKYLRRALDQANRVRGLGHRDSEFQKWKTSTDQVLKRIFRGQSDYPGDYDQSLIIRRNEDRGAKVDRAITLLSSWIEEVEEDWPEADRTSDISNADNIMLRNSNKVFIVHGHDEAARETVARFLESRNLDPVILHEQPNEGRTIIEKIEDNADVGFAVVLLTPDDVGAPATNTDNLKPRARQNVILELGYFIGKLGREKVYALKKHGVETPSDYDGVVYTDLDDAGAWKMELVRELKAAGTDVDADRVFET